MLERIWHSRLLYVSNIVRTSGARTSVSRGLSLPLRKSATIPTSRISRYCSQIKNTHLQNLDRIDWSPRFGFAWQPFGVSHSSVLRGGVGILYDPFQEALAESLLAESSEVQQLHCVHR